jgi:hypothetical protein
VRVNVDFPFMLRVSELSLDPTGRKFIDGHSPFARAKYKVWILKMWFSTAYAGGEYNYF